MRDARVGATIAIEGRAPPWIVVDRDPSSVVVARWPGRLWRVRIVEAATDHDQQAFGGPPVPHAGYTRCIAVAVEAEEDCALLFGAHGAGVVRVLQEALRLSHARAEALANNRHPEAGAARNRIWQGWLRQRAVLQDNHADFDGTLLMGGQRQGSPIHQGLAALHATALGCAQAVDGEATTASDEEDTWLISPWDGANRVLGDAALALGAPEHMSAADRAILLHGWSKVVGDR